MAISADRLRRAFQRYSRPEEPTVGVPGRRPISHVPGDSIRTAVRIAVSDGPGGSSIGSDEIDELTARYSFALFSSVINYSINLERALDRGTIEADLADVLEALMSLRRASARIAERTAGASNEVLVGNPSNAREFEVERVASEFTTAWAGPRKENLVALAKMSMTAQAASETVLDLAPEGPGRRASSPATLHFVTEMAEHFESLTGDRPVASKASGDRRASYDDKSERRTRFVRFMQAVCDGAGVPMPTGSITRTALARRRK